MMKIKTMANNQYIVETDERITFISYETEIAWLDKSTGETWVNPVKYSRTTSKYTNRFCKEYGIINN